MHVLADVFKGVFQKVKIESGKFRKGLVFIEDFRGRRQARLGGFPLREQRFPPDAH
jgi:hypothetical protein